MSVALSSSFEKRSLTFAHMFFNQSDCFATKIQQMKILFNTVGIAAPEKAMKRIFRGLKYSQSKENIMDSHLTLDLYPFQFDG